MGLRIAQIVCTFPPYKGGMGNSVLNYSEKLGELGHDITIFTPYYKKNVGVPRIEKEYFKNVKVVRVKPFFSFGNAAILLRMLKDLRKFDIVHLHYPFYGTAELVAFVKLFYKYGKKMKLIVHYHMDNKASGFKGFLFGIFKTFGLPFVLRMADEITCASLDYVKHSNAGEYWKKSKNKSKFVQVPFGVDINKFTDNNINKNCDNKKNKKNILFVGGLDKQHYFKGVENLIKSFKNLNNEDYTLTIVGKGNMEEYYHTLARELKIDHKINFLNNIDDEKLVCCYNDSDLLVLPSTDKSEAFGLVLLEAMACGKPIIASNLPGVRSVFKNGQQGLLTRAGDVNDLTEKINTILTDEKLAKKFGESARTLVRSKYTWDKAAEKLNEIYYRVRYVPNKEQMKYENKNKK